MGAFLLYHEKMGGAKKMWPIEGSGQLQVCIGRQRKKWAKKTVAGQCAQARSSHLDGI